jgi:hypothetical protein
MARKRKLPPGVVGMAEWKEAKRRAEVRRNQIAFLALPEDVRRQILMDLLSVGFGFQGKKKPPAVEGSGPTDGPSAPSPRSVSDDAE